jgi:hypothetical protein
MSEQNLVANNNDQSIVDFSEYIEGFKNLDELSKLPTQGNNGLFELSHHMFLLHTWLNNNDSSKKAVIYGSWNLFNKYIFEEYGEILWCPRIKTKKQNGALMAIDGSAAVNAAVSVIRLVMDIRAQIKESHKTDPGYRSRMLRRICSLAPTGIKTEDDMIEYISLYDHKKSNQVVKNKRGKFRWKKAKHIVSLKRKKIDELRTFFIENNRLENMHLLFGRMISGEFGYFVHSDVLLILLLQDIYTKYAKRDYDSGA